VSIAWLVMKVHTTCLRPVKEGERCRVLSYRDRYKYTQLVGKSKLEVTSNLMKTWRGAGQRPMKSQEVTIE
jgi:hypothetical protein